MDYNEKTGELQVRAAEIMNNGMDLVDLLLL